MKGDEATPKQLKMHGWKAVEVTLESGEKEYYRADGLLRELNRRRQICETAVADADAVYTDLCDALKTGCYVSDAEREAVGMMADALRQLHGASLEIVREISKWLKEQGA